MNISGKGMNNRVFCGRSYKFLGIFILLFVAAGVVYSVEQEEQGAASEMKYVSDATIDRQGEISQPVPSSTLKAKLVQLDKLETKALGTVVVNKPKQTTNTPTISSKTTVVFKPTSTAISSNTVKSGASPSTPVATVLSSLRKLIPVSTDEKPDNVIKETATTETKGVVAKVATNVSKAVKMLVGIENHEENNESKIIDEEDDVPQEASVASVATGKKDTQKTVKSKPSADVQIKSQNQTVADTIAAVTVKQTDKQIKSVPEKTDLTVSDFVENDLTGITETSNSAANVSSVSKSSFFKRVWEGIVYFFKGLFSDGNMMAKKNEAMLITDFLQQENKQGDVVSATTSLRVSNKPPNIFAAVANDFFESSNEAANAVNAGVQNLQQKLNSDTGSILKSTREGVKTTSVPRLRVTNVRMTDNLQSVDGLMYQFYNPYPDSIDFYGLPLVFIEAYDDPRSTLPVQRDDYIVPSLSFSRTFVWINQNWISEPTIQ